MLSCLAVGVRRRRRVPDFDGLVPACVVEETDFPRRIDANSSNAETAALVKVALKELSTAPVFTRLVLSTGATFQRLRTRYFEDVMIPSLKRQKAISSACNHTINMVLWKEMAITSLVVEFVAYHDREVDDEFEIRV